MKPNSIHFFATTYYAVQNGFMNLWVYRMKPVSWLAVYKVVLAFEFVDEIL